jgi:hypothetical protein
MQIKPKSFFQNILVVTPVKAKLKELELLNEKYNLKFKQLLRKSMQFFTYILKSY